MAGLKKENKVIKTHLLHSRHGGPGRREQRRAGRSAPAGGQPEKMKRKCGVV
jgi:hypothetical protein